MKNHYKEMCKLERVKGIFDISTKHVKHQRNPEKIPKSSCPINWSVRNIQETLSNNINKNELKSKQFNLK